jgi:hypothetical protein
MMMGTSVAPGADAFAVARLLGSIALLVDGKAVAEQLRELATAMQAHNAALEQIAQREKDLNDREASVTKREQEVTAASVQLAEKTRAHAHAAQRLEEAQTSFDTLRRDVREQLQAA